MTLKYRPEIDGLRAVAVLAVIFYHAEFIIFDINPFKGGFIGVDIFFVISGYLITAIILREINEGRFSLAQFYTRRARRILPALLFVMLVSLPFAYIYMMPKALNEYAGASLSTLGFGSNIWFWLEDSYTAEPSKLKPLLHTWTLAVEEQFYILFPPLIMGLMAFARRAILPVFIIGFLLSLQLAQTYSASNPDATFFLLHTRIWELLAGAILAKLELDRGRSPSRHSAYMPAIGLLAIAYAIVTFEDTILHPSYMTAIPVIGTMLVIWFSADGKAVTKILSLRSIVAIGLISYSLYLWHYPIFAFARIDMGELTFEIKLACLALSFILAGISYKCVEQPLRRDAKPVTFALFILIVGNALVFANLYFHKTDGAKYRLAAYDSLFDVSTGDIIEGQSCFSPRPDLGAHCKFTRDGAKRTIIGIGDSHLAMLGPSLKALADKLNMNYEQFPHCVFIKDTEIHKTDKTIVANPCPEKQLAELAKYENAIIVKASRLTWRITGKDSGGGPSDKYAPTQQGVTIEKALQDTNESILAIGHTLVQIYPVPELKFSAQYNLKKLLKGYEFEYQKRLKDIEQDPKMTGLLSEYLERHDISLKSLNAVQHPNYIPIYPHKILCDENTNACETLRDGNLLYRDMNHLTNSGAALIIKEIESQLTP